MSINQRQFNQLTEMGISLWQSKSNDSDINYSNTDDTKQEALYLNCNNEGLSSFASQVVFTDILLSLGLSIGEVNIKQNHLDLGLFNWYFNADPQNDTAIQCIDNNLISPNITLIRQSPTLKKQLWKAITEHLL